MRIGLGHTRKKEINMKIAKLDLILLIAMFVGFLALIRLAVVYHMNWQMWAVIGAYGLLLIAIGELLKLGE